MWQIKFYFVSLFIVFFLVFFIVSMRKKYARFMARRYKHKGWNGEYYDRVINDYQKIFPRQNKIILVSTFFSYTFLCLFLWVLSHIARQLLRGR